MNHQLVSVDVWHRTFERLGLARRSDSPTCVEGRYEYLSARAGFAAEQLCGNDSIRLRPHSPLAMDLAGLAERLRGPGNVHHNFFLLRFREKGREVMVFHDGRAMVRGVDDLAAARRLYDKYVGY